MIDVNDPPKEVTRWIKRFERLCKDAPPGIWVFVTGAVIVHALDNDGHVVYANGGGVDRATAIAHVKTHALSFDGGDY